MESPWIADFWCWTWPEVAILGADQKERASGDENADPDSGRCCFACPVGFSSFYDFFFFTQYMGVPPPPPPAPSPSSATKNHAVFEGYAIFWDMVCDSLC